MFKSNELERVVAVMKITVFNGSPKAERGNTHWMVTEFLKGAKEAGAEVENIFLAGKEIHPCKACYSCWMKTPGKCATRDDMEELFQKVISSDVLGFATPLYVDNVTGMMKNFMDRLIPLADPHFETDQNGESRHLRKHEKPRKFAVISSCGFPEQSHFQVLRVLFKRIARNLSGELVAEIYRGGGGVLEDRKLFPLPPHLESYAKLLQTAGKEVVLNSKLSEETKALLEKPPIPTPNFAEDYRREANKLFDERLKKLGR
jgi:multimeric flavodoxin WrbA